MVNMDEKGRSRRSVAEPEDARTRIDHTASSSRLAAVRLNIPTEEQDQDSSSGSTSDSGKGVVKEQQQGLNKVSNQPPHPRNQYMGQSVLFGSPISHPG